MKFGKTTVATAALAAVLTMTACGSDESNDKGAATSTTTTTTAATTEAAAYPPVPTAAELNASLAMAFDETVPLEQKIPLVQGAEQDPELINQVAAAAKANDAVITVVDVVDGGDGTATAGIDMIIGGNPNPGTVVFVAEDGVWKLSKDNACGFVSLAQLTSPVCS
ncbi:hypothetical protein [Rhodococcus sp. NPDC003383]